MIRSVFPLSFLVTAGCLSSEKTETSRTTTEEVSTDTAETANRTSQGSTDSATKTCEPTQTEDRVPDLQVMNRRDIEMSVTVSVVSAATGEEALRSTTRIPPGEVSNWEITVNQEGRYEFSIRVENQTHEKVYSISSTSIHNHGIEIFIREGEIGFAEKYAASPPKSDDC